ncbi:MAG: hypothetical protein JXA06_07695 [Bacteroidetes bacterium]|nr:hypothetical protein [Bacteroidota bacterium]
MEWEIKIHQDPNYVEIVTHGVADKDDTLQMAFAITKTMRENKITRALIDHRKITKVTGEIAEVYNRPKIFRLIGVVLGIKIAEVINPEHSGHFKFLETICDSRGFKFSVFNQWEPAMEWLLK